MVSVARVRTAATPQSAPTELDKYLIPQFQDGSVADWKIDYRRVLTSPDIAAVTEKVGQWRRSWAWEYLLGRKDAVAGMVDAYVGMGGEPPAILAGMGEQLAKGNEITVSDIEGLRREVQAVQNTFRSSGRRGWALFTPGKQGTVWASVWQDETEIVAEAGGDRVICRTDGFYYIHSNRESPLIGWARRGGRVRLAVGERADLGNDGESNAHWVVARPEFSHALSLAVEGADPIRTIQLPLAAIYAKVIIGLTEAANVSEAHKTSITVYSARNEGPRLDV